MPILHAIILGIVQGLSEFLPISSSGHLILVPEILGWNDFAGEPSLQKTFDVALHIGTFIGAAFFFRHDLVRYFKAGVHSIIRRRVSTTDERIAWLLLLSAIPAAIVGGLFSDVIERNTNSPILIGVMSIVFALVLYWTDHLPAVRPTEEFSKRDAILMGAAQALALQPGVSRSGVTVSMGRWLKFDRPAAVRISFLMSLPIIFGAGLFKGLQVLAGDGVPADLVPAFIWGMLAAMVSGFVAIAWLLRYVQTRTLTPFVIYRIVLGVIVIIVFATGWR